MNKKNKKHKILAIIPARGGSKGLPNKNILSCAGKPLIAWTIKAALESKNINRVIVSTDSLEIKKVSEQEGVLVPFLRSSSLSDDDASVTDVVYDVLNRCKKDGDEFDFVVLLQPTSPLRNSKHIDEAIELFFSKRNRDQDTLISVYEIEKKILWVKGIGSDGYIYDHFDADLSNPRRQKLPNCYLPNGGIYIASTINFIGFYGTGIIPYIMPKRYSIDIDSQEDLDNAIEVILQERVYL